MWFISVLGHSLNDQLRRIGTGLAGEADSCAAGSCERNAVGAIAGDQGSKIYTCPSSPIEGT